MKVIQVLVFCIFSLLSTNLLAQGIQFRKGTWANIQAQAKTENKYIFVDAYTTCTSSKI